MTKIFAALQALVRYLPAPAFFALGLANFLLAGSGDPHARHGGAMTGMTRDSDQFTSLFAAFLHDPAIGSMWLMYLLIGFAHLSPWLLGGGEPRSERNPRQKT